MLPSRRETKSPVLMERWRSDRVLELTGIPVTHLRAGLFSEWLFYVSRLIRQGWSELAFRNAVSNDL